MNIINKEEENFRFGNTKEIIDNNEQTGVNVNADESDLCADTDTEDNIQTENNTYLEQSGNRSVATQDGMSKSSDYSKELDGKNA